MISHLNSLLCGEKCTEAYHIEFRQNIMTSHFRFQVWFKNRRAKYRKRQKFAEHSSTTESSSQHPPASLVHYQPVSGGNDDDRRPLLPPGLIATESSEDDRHTMHSRTPDAEMEKPNEQIERVTESPGEAQKLKWAEKLIRVSEMCLTETQVVSSVLWQYAKEYAQYVQFKAPSQNSFRALGFLWMIQSTNVIKHMLSSFASLEWKNENENEVKMESYECVSDWKPINPQRD